MRAASTEYDPVLFWPGREPVWAWDLLEEAIDLLEQVLITLGRIVRSFRLYETPTLWQTVEIVRQLLN